MKKEDYKSYAPVNGMVEPDFLEYLKKTFQKWQQFYEESVPLGSREISKLSNTVDGARMNARFGFERVLQRTTDEERVERISLTIYKNREEMEIDAEPLYRFETKIHK